jgi:uncharacterized membrane protein YozB (DUF420 family)
MDAKLAFWTAAFANMVLAASLALRGVALARRGEFVRHARCMRAAAAFVALFLAAYAAKLGILGREAVETWSPGAVTMLRIHELCVLTMLLGGGTALALGRRLGRSALVTRAAADPAAPGATRRRHRLAGRTAVGGALFGAATAALVLGGMYARAALLDAPVLARVERAAPAAP